MLIQFIEHIYKYMSNIKCHYITSKPKRVSFNTDIVGDAIEPPMAHNIDRNNIDNPRKNFNRNHSYSSTNYYCGFCSNSIFIPIHMYCDKPYCSIICRNNQYKMDNSNTIREHHSFSV